MTTELVLLVICCIAIVFLIVFRKTTFVKKYWKYALVLIPAVLILVLKILSTIRSNSKTTSTTEQDELKDHISEVKEQLQEVNTVVKIEAAVAKNENQQLMTELKDAQKIEDNRERRKRLAELMG